MTGQYKKGQQTGNGKCRAISQKRKKEDMMRDWRKSLNKLWPKICAKGNKNLGTLEIFELVLFYFWLLWLHPFYDLQKERTRCRGKGKQRNGRNEIRENTLLSPSKWSKVTRMRLKKRPRMNGWSAETILVTVLCLNWHSTEHPADSKSAPLSLFLSWHHTIWTFRFRR